MSEPLIGQAQPEQIPVQWYNVIKPGSVVDANGGRQLAVLGTYPDLATASQHAGTVGGSWIVLNVLLHINPSAIQTLKAAN